MRISLLLAFSFISISTASFAGLTDLYTSTSKSLYEFVENKSCSDLSFGTVDTGVCRGNCAKKNDFSKEIDKFVEFGYFQQAAILELDNLSCALSRVESAKKDRLLSEKIKSDLLEKLPNLSLLYHEHVLAKYQYLQLQGRAKAMSSAASASKENQLAYDNALKASWAEELRAQKIAASLDVMLSSTWFGNTQASRTMLKKLYEKDYTGSKSDLKQFDKYFVSFFKNITTELQTDKAHIMGQARIENGHPVFDNLDLKTRTLLIQNPNYLQSYAELIELSPITATQLQCQLEGKYGKGIQYLDKTIMGASLLLSGGGFLLSKVPVIVTSVLGKAVNLGEVSFTSARVLTAASAGLTTHLVLEDFDRNCLSSTQSRIQKNICSLDNKAMSEAEQMQLEESNCALSVAINGLSVLALVPKLKIIFKNSNVTTKSIIQP